MRQPRPAPFKQIGSFLADYVPLEYMLEPIVRTSSLYTLTAKTGAGKTAFLVVAGYAVATGRRDILNMDVGSGRVAYLAFENPDDVRMRLMTAAYLLNIDAAALLDRFLVLDVRMSPEDIIPELRRRAEQGPFALVVADTLAAFFDGRDINDNVEGGNFMRRLRPLTMLPGRPAVIVAAHPVKNASDDQLVPYGGGAILNEVDGNLTLAKKADTGAITLHWQGKFRGLEFQPIPFRLEMTSSPDVIDVRGREIILPTMRPSTSEDAEQRQATEVNRDVALLKAMAADPEGGTRGWSAATAIPLGSVVRKLAELAKAKLVEKSISGRWRLTPKGTKEVIQLVDQRGGVDHP